VIAWGRRQLERRGLRLVYPHKATFLFEVEWTAMSAIRSCSSQRFPSDDKVVRFLVVREAPSWCDTTRSFALLRRAFAERNWHVLKWDQLPPSRRATTCR